MRPDPVQKQVLILRLIRSAASIVLFFIFLLPSYAPAQETIHHDLKVRLDPAHHRLEVEDTIRIPESLRPAPGKSLTFTLHEGLHPVSMTEGVTMTRIGPGQNESGGVPVHRYSVALPQGRVTFTIRYSGKIHHPLEQRMARSTRSQQESSGIISEDGVLLGRDSAWFPAFAEPFLSFTLSVEAPEGWEVISQGDRTRHEIKAGSRQIRWESPEPQDEILLVGGPLTEFVRSAGEIEAMVFLHEPDAALAEKYLEATVQYLEMYSRLIGPYPYRKFALVENFWETGYGMPSFTLLGPQVIRLPFILHSSYPHEILHNWWGNSVYIDYATGNWAEGLTAYLADHLIHEQRGTGADYRRSTLQKYADYVNASEDFPLTAFRARHSSETEAVGYGKTMMLFHMLRLKLGDQAFRRSLRTFYSDNKFRHASFDDLRRVFVKTGGTEVGPWFDSWVLHPGAPALNLAEARVARKGENFLLTARIEQTQLGPAYTLDIPVVVYLENRETSVQTNVLMDQKVQDVELRLAARPLRLDLDPEFDLFRRLDRNEVPPALSGAFGSEKTLILLPAAASGPVREGFRQWADSWKRTQPIPIEIALDKDFPALPEDRDVWLFGWNNRFRGELRSSLSDYGVVMDGESVRIGETHLERSAHSVVITIRHPKNTARSITWVGADRPAAMPGLARKLPHYGKYSYLGFEGEEPTNMAKGNWPVIHSPLSVVFPGEVKTRPITAFGKLAPRQALASLPPAFSEERMTADIRWLADARRQGRGFGSPGLDEAAGFIAAQFQEAGLAPGGDSERGYFQEWKEHGGDPEREAVLKNVIGVLPGTRQDWDGQSVVIGAHYDHLGMGWPNAHLGDAGKIHPGADDNASGVAVLIELARVLARRGPPERTIVFAAFTGEEAGLRGSRYYIDQEARFPVEKAIGMINLDTVGRLGDNDLLVLGTGSAREWVHIFRGAGFVTGVSLRTVADDFGSSDQKSFLDAGVPAVQLFSGPHPDYHRPGDTADKVEFTGLVMVASVVAEAVEYLASRTEPLNATLARTGGPGRAPSDPGAGRRISLGTIPDFAYEGKGVRLEALSPGSPAEAAGLASGDIIIRVDEAPIVNLQGYAEALKKLSPGQSVTITFVRDGQERSLTLEAAER